MAPTMLKRPVRNTPTGRPQRRIIKPARDRRGQQGTRYQQAVEAVVGGKLQGRARPRQEGASAAAASPQTKQPRIMGGYCRGDQAAEEQGPSCSADSGADVPSQPTACMPWPHRYRFTAAARPVPLPGAWSRWPGHCNGAGRAVAQRRCTAHWLRHSTSRAHRAPPHKQGRLTCWSTGSKGSPCGPRSWDLQWGGVGRGGEHSRLIRVVGLCPAQPQAAAAADSGRHLQNFLRKEVLVNRPPTTPES